MGYIIGGIVVVILFALGGNGGTITERVCDPNTGTFHDITYQKAFTGSKGKQTSDQNTGIQCQCEVTGIGQSRPVLTRTFSALRPRQEDNCHSSDTNGTSQPVPNQAAAASTSGFGGTGSNSGPSPEDRRLRPNVMAGPSSLPAARSLDTRAVTTGSAFTYTLPFRYLPTGPLITGTSVPAPQTCNASLNPTFFRVYHVDDVVKRYNMCTGQTVATINVPDLPLQVKVTPDGSQAIVTSYSGAITFINTATNKVSGSITVPTDPNFAPSGIAISPDGSYALVTNYLTPPSSYLAVVDIASMQIKGKIPLDNDYPESVYINPDGTLAWVTYPWFDSVEVVDILTGSVVQKFNIVEPFSIVFTPTGTRAFVSSGSGSVEVMDTSTYQLTKTIPAGAGATDLQMSPDGLFVFVNNSSAKSVTVIETGSLDATTTSINGTPLGAVLMPTQ